MNEVFSEYLLKYFFDKYEGDWTKINDAIKNKDPISPNHDFGNKFNNSFSLLNEHIASKFKNSNYIPYFLWFEGEKSLIGKETFLLNNNFNFNHIDQIDFNKYIPVINFNYFEERFLEILIKKHIPFIAVVKNLDKNIIEKYKKRLNSKCLFISWNPSWTNIDRYFIVDEQDKLNKITYSLTNYYTSDLDQVYLLEKYNIQLKYVSIENLFKNVEVKPNKKEKIKSGKNKNQKTNKSLSFSFKNFKNKSKVWSNAKKVLKDYQKYVKTIKSDDKNSNIKNVDQIDLNKEGESIIAKEKKSNKFLDKFKKYVKKIKSKLMKIFEKNEKGMVVIDGN